METPHVLYLLLVGATSYLIGSTPFAYLIVKRVTGEDITSHGTGNVGAMNVRRSTGSWSWFALAMVLDAGKGFTPALAAKWLALRVSTSSFGPLLPWSRVLSSAESTWSNQLVYYVPMMAVAGAVLGHNYSLWMALLKRRFTRTGKGLATGGGALLAYDWRYFLAVLVVGLAFIALTRYMMAGQVAAAVALPLTATALRSPDLPFAVLMGLVVYLAHHKRFMGLLRGREPRLYVNDRMGPRG